MSTYPKHDLDKNNFISDESKTINKESVAVLTDSLNSTFFVGYLTRVIVSFAPGFRNRWFDANAEFASPSS